MPMPLTSAQVSTGVVNGRRCNGGRLRLAVLLLTNSASLAFRVVLFGRAATRSSCMVLKCPDRLATGCRVGGADAAARAGA